MRQCQDCLLPATTQLHAANCSSDQETEESCSRPSNRPIGWGHKHWDPALMRDPRTLLDTPRSADTLPCVVSTPMGATARSACGGATRGGDTRLLGSTGAIPSSMREGNTAVDSGPYACEGLPPGETDLDVIGAGQTSRNSAMEAVLLEETAQDGGATEADDVRSRSPWQCDGNRSDADTHTPDMLSRSKVLEQQTIHHEVRFPLEHEDNTMGGAALLRSPIGSVAAIDGPNQGLPTTSISRDPLSPYCIASEPRITGGTASQLDSGLQSSVSHASCSGAPLSGPHEQGPFPSARTEYDPLGDEPSGSLLKGVSPGQYADEETRLNEEKVLLEHFVAASASQSVLSAAIPADTTRLDAAVAIPCPTPYAGQEHDISQEDAPTQGSPARAPILRMTTPACDHHDGQSTQGNPAVRINNALSHMGDELQHLRDIHGEGDHFDYCAVLPSGEHEDDDDTGGATQGNAVDAPEYLVSAHPGPEEATATQGSPVAAPRPHIFDDAGVDDAPTQPSPAVAPVPRATHVEQAAMTSALEAQPISDEGSPLLPLGAQNLSAQPADASRAADQTSGRSDVDRSSHGHQLQALRLDESDSTPEADSVVPAVQFGAHVAATSSPDVTSSNGGAINDDDLYQGDPPNACTQSYLDAPVMDAMTSALGILSTPQNGSCGSMTAENHSNSAAAKELTTVAGADQAVGWSSNNEGQQISAANLLTASNSPDHEHTISQHDTPSANGANETTGMENASFANASCVASNRCVASNLNCTSESELLSGHVATTVHGRLAQCPGVAPSTEPSTHDNAVPMTSTSQCYAVGDLSPLELQARSTPTLPEMRLVQGNDVEEAVSCDTTKRVPECIIPGGTSDKEYESAMLGRRSLAQNDTERHLSREQQDVHSNCAPHQSRDPAAQPFTTRGSDPRHRSSSSRVWAAESTEL